MEVADCPELDRRRSAGVCELPTALKFLLKTAGGPRLDRAELLGAALDDRKGGRYRALHRRGIESPRKTSTPTAGQHKRFTPAPSRSVAERGCRRAKRT